MITGSGRWIPPSLPISKSPEHEKESGSTYAAGRSKDHVVVDPVVQESNMKVIKPMQAEEDTEFHPNPSRRETLAVPYVGTRTIQDLKAVPEVPL